MSKRLYRVLFVTSMMIFTSLAGCIDSSDTDEDVVELEPEQEYYGKIMTSTYHVEQLVSAIVGDTATVEMMSTTNIPVHDYTPSLIDIERLKGSDVFFYHGLELEPWVDATLSSEGVPPSYMTHVMPSGEITLDYQTMLVNDLCEQLTSGDKQPNNLLSYEDQAGQLEIHLEKGVQTLTFPPADTSYEGHDHDEDGHDDHDEDGHDDHDGEGGHDDHDGHGDHDAHDDHAHAEAEKVIENPVNCPTNTVISVFHLEEGEHIVEFETVSGVTTMFDMAALPMMGGHAHHHHHEGHGDEDGHDDHGDHGSDGDHGDSGDVCYDMSAHESHDEYTTEEDCEAAGYMWMEGDDDHDDHEEDRPFDLTPELILEFFDTNSDGTLSWDEFWASWVEDGDDDDDDDDHGDHDDNHGDGDHDDDHGDGDGDHDGDHDDDHGDGDGDHDDDHGDDGHGDHADDHEAEMAALMDIFNESDTNMDGLLDTNELEEFIHEIMEFEEEHHDGHDDHDDHGSHDDHDDAVCHDPVTHADTEHTDRTSCEEAGNIWMAGEPNDGTRGYLTIHVENEGDYGFAVPSDVSVFILMGEGGHDDHDDHSGHGGHDDHGEGGHDDHDDHGEGGHDDHDEDTHSDDESTDGGDSTIAADEDEDFEYDPHSWLDPISFKAQTQLVLNALIEVFPNGSDTFTANAEVFMAELDKVHLGYVGAFGPEGTCTNKTAAANHNAYSYITERYGVEFVTVHGLDPEGQPSVEDIEKVISKINEDEISVLYIEEYTQASSVDLIVEATNVEVMYLYTMEKAPSDANDDYLSMLNKNLDNLKAGLGCAA